MKNYLFLGLVIIALFFLCGTSVVYASDVLIFHFEQDNGTLVLDPDLSKSITLENDPNFSVLAFSKTAVSGEYRMELFVSGSNEPAFYEFSGKEGKFVYEMPHYGVVDRYKIYSTKDGRLLLEGSLVEFVQCNANGICEYEKGENMNTCLADCSSGNFSDETKKLLAQNGDILKDPKTGDILLRGPEAMAAVTNAPVSAQSGSGNTVVLVILVAFLVVIGIFVVVILRIRKRNRRYGL